MAEQLYPLPPSLDKRPFWVSMAGISFPDPAYRITWNDNNLTVIDFVEKGRGTMLMDGTRYEIGPGDVYILPPHHRLDYRSDPEDPMHKYFFRMHGDLVPLLLASHRLDTEVIVPGTDTLPLFKKGLELITGGTLKPARLQYELEIIIHRIIVACAATLPDAEAALPDDVRTVKRHLDTHVDGKVTMDELCALVHKSRVQLIRSFRKAMGRPPYDYYLSLKAERAKQLLRNTARPVKEIGYGLGFGDEYHFSAFFKKRVGKSPLQYRQD